MLLTEGAVALVQTPGDQLKDLRNITITCYFLNTIITRIPYSLKSQKKLKRENAKIICKFSI